jgi:hypothetical protein
MYRTTKEENEVLTRVGQGTPMGELLRRYWWPVAISAHLQDKPTFIRVLGEDLVLYRDATGHPAIVRPSPSQFMSRERRKRRIEMPLSWLALRQ